MANPAWKKGGASPNPHGGRKSDRIAARNLAIALRDLVGEEEIARCLRMMAAGIDPDVIDPETGWPAWKSGVARKGYIPLDWGQRLSAWKMLLERRDGQAPQHVVIEAEVKAHSALHGLAVDLGSYSLEDLRKIKDILAKPKMPDTAPSEQLAPGVIDAEAIEAKPKP